MNFLTEVVHLLFSQTTFQEGTCIDARRDVALEVHLWQFPTVSMGLGPIGAIYQAKFLKYLEHRGLKDTSEQTVYAFLGDGEMDERVAMVIAPLDSGSSISPSPRKA